MIQIVIHVYILRYRVPRLLWTKANIFPLLAVDAVLPLRSLQSPISPSLRTTSSRPTSGGLLPGPNPDLLAAPRCSMRPRLGRLSSAQSLHMGRLGVLHQAVCVELEMGD